MRSLVGKGKVIQEEMVDRFCEQAVEQKEKKKKFIGFQIPGSTSMKAEKQLHSSSTLIFGFRTFNPDTSLCSNGTNY